MKRRTFWHSVRDAAIGFAFAVRSQRNVRIELTIAVLVVVTGACLGIGAGEWAILVLMMAGVVAAEVVNTAIEALVDLVSPQLQDRARIAKDAAAGAVLVMAVASIVVGVAILGPPLWRIVRQVL